MVVALPVLASIPVDGVAARVNGHVITLSDVLGSSSELQMLLRQGQGGEQANAAYQRMLDEWIHRKLILDAYEDQKTIKIPEEMVDAQVEELVHERFDGDRNAFLQALGEEGRSEQAWREDVREQVIFRAMRNLRVDRHIRISPTEIRAHYEADPARFGEPPAWTYRMLVLPDGESKAGTTQQAEVAAALREGKPFEAVVQQFSSDSMAASGGLRGPVTPEQVRPNLREALAALDEGEVSGPISLEQHVVWLQMVKRQEAAVPSYEEAYDEVRQSLYRERADALFEAWMERLKQQAFVSILVSAPF